MSGLDADDHGAGAAAFTVMTPPRPQAAQPSETGRWLLVLGAWFQATGSLLSVAFFVFLVRMAGAERASPTRLPSADQRYKEGRPPSSVQPRAVSARCQESSQADRAVIQDTVQLTAHASDHHPSR
jgi:hypothetical protein